MNAIAPYKQFEVEIDQRRAELESILPPHVSAEKFQQIALIAVKNNPELLEADRRSLHAAVTQAAEDGIHPDGREGTIQIFNTKVKIDGKEVWIKKAQYSPMLYGIRKRAREVCDMTIDAQVVYQNDHFVWHQGDDPRIEHTPAPLGKDRGKAVGAYAIFKQDGAVLHREVMDHAQIEAVRGQSRNSNGLLWTKFWTEGARKSVIRRGIKTVPSVQALSRIIERDDQDFDFGNKQPARALPDVPSAPVARQIQQQQPAEEAMIAEMPDEMDAETVADEAPKVAEKPAQQTPSVMAAFNKAIAAAENGEALNSLWAMFDSKLTGDDREIAIAAFDKRFEALN